MYQLTPLDPCR